MTENSAWRKMLCCSLSFCYFDRSDSHAEGHRLSERIRVRIPNSIVRVGQG